MLPWDPSAPRDAEGHALWIPRQYQGRGRHDAPDRYGCLYLAEAAVSAVAEALAPFRGTGDLHPGLLVRSGRRLALAELELHDTAAVLDLDDPAVLVDESLRPSLVATNRRVVTQAQAAALFDRHPDAAGLRWWSVLEASWGQVTLFDRGAAELTVGSVVPLTVDAAAVAEAAVFLGLG